MYFPVQVTHLLSAGECFHRCASKCAISTRVSSITSRWTSCPWTPNATGVSVSEMNPTPLTCGLLISIRALSQVRVPQLAVDGGREHGPLLHLPEALRAPGLAVRWGDVDASGHQL